MTFSLLLLFPVVSSLTCTSCPFRFDSPHSLFCNESCEGDICFIVVNKYFNGTVIAGCLHAADDDTVHNGTSVCHRDSEHTVCACTSSDKCNDPRAPLSEFEFTEYKILEGYQIFPQIQPTEPSVVLLENESNRTSHDDEPVKEMRPVEKVNMTSEETTDEKEGKTRKEEMKKIQKIIGGNKEISSYSSTDTPNSASSSSAPSTRITKPAAKHSTLNTLSLCFIVAAIL